MHKQLERDGYRVGLLHGGIAGAAPSAGLFRRGRWDLIATNVAARGLDVPAVSHVVNYDIPEELRPTFTASDGRPAPARRVSRRRPLASRTFRRSRASAALPSKVREKRLSIYN
ncbi:MAG: helicase-related protein [Chloroflexia bacterium]